MGFPSILSPFAHLYSIDFDVNQAKNVEEMKEIAIRTGQAVSPIHNVISSPVIQSQNIFKQTFIKACQAKIKKEEHYRINDRLRYYLALVSEYLPIGGVAMVNPEKAAVNAAISVLLEPKIGNVNTMVMFLCFCENEVRPSKYNFTKPFSIPSLKEWHNACISRLTESDKSKLKIIENKHPTNPEIVERISGDILNTLRIIGRINLDGKITQDMVMDSVIDVAICIAPTNKSSIKIPSPNIIREVRKVFEIRMDCRLNKA